MKHQSGNALFLILIAVALFAALSYAITQSSRGGAGIDRELETIDTAVNQQCAASVDAGIMRLKLIGGCGTDEISYELASGVNANPEAPTDKSCHLFHSNGAGVAACGEYLNPLVETGNITSRGDTTTIALLGGVSYITCPSWPWECAINVSPTGSDFRQACLEDDSTPTSRYEFDVTFTYGFAGAFCSASCGGDFSYETSSGSGGPAYYIKDDYSLTDVTGSCSRYITRVECDCW